MKDQFSKFINEDKLLKNAADIAIKESLKVKEGEQVLIITNADNDVFEISRALYDACIRVGANPVLSVQKEKTLLDYAENCIVGAIKAEPDVLISMSAEKMGKDQEAILKPYEVGSKKIDSTFHYLMEAKKCRSFWSPGVTKAAFINTVPIDYARLKKECDALKVVLDQATGVRVQAAGGTDLYIGLKNRVAFVDDGDFSKPGDGGNLPAGEAFISPELGTTNGVIGFDGSIAVKNGTVKIDQPIICKVENGFVTDISGGKEADILRETVEAGKNDAIKMEEKGALPKGTGSIYSKNAFNIGELGIGTNPSADITGNMLVDEKAYKTCHIAIGSNYDDDARALIHLDGVIKNPTITAILENGKEVIMLENGTIVI